MGRIVWIVPWLTVVCVSCAGGGDEVATPEVVRSADIVRQDEGVTSKYFDVENPYTLERVDAILESADVQSAVQYFEDLGYTREPQHTFVAEGEGPDGESVEMAALAMNPPTGTSTHVVYVLDILGGGSEWVVPLTVSFAGDPNRDDSYEIGEGVWVALAGEPMSAAANLAPAQVSWRDWLRCVVERIVAGAASCAWTCRHFGGLYLPCLAKCTAGYAIFAIFYCAFQQM